MRLDKKTLLSFLAVISLTLASCETQNHESSCIDVSQIKLLTEIANKYEIDPEVLTIVNTRNLYGLRSYSRKQNYYYYKMKDDSRLKCDIEKFKSHLVSHQFHYPSDNPDLIANVVITYSSNGRIEYVSFSALGDPGAWGSFGKKKLNRP